MSKIKLVVSLYDPDIFIQIEIKKKDSRKIIYLYI